MTAVGEALRSAAEELAGTSDTARLDAELLMAHALGVSRSDMLLRHMAAEAPEDFAALIERRAAHEPVAYLTGQQEFYGLELSVTRDVLIPRGDSETLIEAARSHFTDSNPPARICDLGTGSGALLLAALYVWRQAAGVGVERSYGAIRIAKRNACALEFADRVTLFRRDWRKTGWQRDLGRFDLLLCNPPYVEADADLEPGVMDYEPSSALFAGADGLGDYRILIPAVADLLLPEGVAIFEIGSTQSDAVSDLARQFSFQASIHRDLGGRPRAVLLKRSGDRAKAHR